jgi:hypothetical protein
MNVLYDQDSRRPDVYTLSGREGVEVRINQNDKTATWKEK